MGLVTCSKCKKIYDYDKYNGICPKCARYNKESSAAEDHQEYHNKYDGGYTHTAQDNHHSYHQKYDENKNPHISQLEGVQETLKEVMGAEHKVNLEGATKKSGSMDKKTKMILGIIIFVFAVNFILPFLGILFIPIMIGVVMYLVRKNKK
ncbi:MAG: hypothetical protein J6K04_01060 [Lachnospiraceae bacterium]|nr:hypothetical protein [Lachnospiraceae bacterium]